MSPPTRPTVVPAKLGAALMGVAAVVAMALLAGCGSAHTDTPTPPPNAAATTSTSAATSPPTTADGRRRGTRGPATTRIAATTEPTVATSAAATTDATSTTTVSGGDSTSSTTALPTSTSAASTTATPASQVRVIADCQTASYEPATIILACGDGGISATRISWTSWAATSATGTAVIVANLCNPDCAQGSTGSFPAAITLSGVTTGSSGTIFSSLTANFAGPSPSGTPSETYSLAGLG